MNHKKIFGTCEFCDKDFKKQSSFQHHLNPKHKFYCKLAYKFNLWHERKIKDDFEITKKEEKGKRAHFVF